MCNLTRKQTELEGALIKKLTWYARTNVLYKCIQTAHRECMKTNYTFFNTIKKHSLHTEYNHIICTQYSE